MNRWTTSAVLLLVAALAGGCSNNNAKAGIVISAASTTTGANSVTVPINGTEQFAASVTGVSDTQVYWQVCLPATTTAILPTDCTTIPGVTLPKGDTVLTGFGTINQNGFYTAPSQIPNPNSFIILATSPVDITAFGTFTVTIDSGIRVQVTPPSATIDAGETQQFTATVTGSSNTSVTWEVNNLAGGDPNSVGAISSSGLYQAPPTGTASVTIKAVSGADGSTSGTATVSIVSAVPAVSSIEPQITEQGAAQQDVYLAGTDFTSNGSVLVAANGMNITDGTPLPYVFLSASLVRVSIPASVLVSPGTVAIAFQLQPIPPALGQISNTQSLGVVSVRPSIVGASTQSFTSTSAAATVNLTGGFFSSQAPATTAQFDCQCNGESPATLVVNNSRQLSVTVPAGGLANPGLYPLAVQNPGAATAGQPSMAAINIAVTPASIPGAPGAIPAISLAPSTQPSAIALDFADGLAVVTEKDTNSVAIVNLATNTLVGSPITVGKQPTSVAVDDLLPHPLALVVNSGDNTVSVIDLKTLSLAAAPINPLISLAGLTPSMSAPVAIGINSQTHRAIVANSSTNLATIIDLVNANSTLNPACANAPCPLMVIGGTSTGYGTGGSPQIGIDPSLNWAVVSPGGAGSINLVDLGFGSVNAGSGGRAPAVIGTLSLSTTVQGVGIDPETHTALFTDYNSGNVTTFSILDNTVNSVTNFGVALDNQGELSAAVNPLQNIGVALNTSGAGTASVVDLGNHVVLQTIANIAGSFGGSPQAVAVDPATNEALIVNSGPGSLSIVPLGPTPSIAKPLQIIESSPANTFTSTSPLALTINGMGFTAGSSVLLDGTPVAGATFVSARQMQVTVPATLLASARRFSVQVQNANGTLSNVEPLSVVQAVTVGTAPAGVAVDPDRDAAVVTNSGSGDISLVSVAPPSISPQSLGPVGLITPPAALTAHLNPRAVAVDARLGLAVAANFDSNDLSLLDYSNVYQQGAYTLPAVAGCSQSSVCTGPAGIAFNQDTNGFLVTDSNIGTTTSDVAFGTVTPPSSGSGGVTKAGISSPFTPQPVDQTPGDLAIAPAFDPFDPVNNPTPLLTYAAIASSAQTSVIDFMNTATELVVGRTSGVAQPTGVVYDSLNHVFLVSDSLDNNIVIVSPLTFVPVFVRGGFNPSSIAYNFQTSTIVAVNAATGTLSVMDYLCPPSTATPACTSPQVRSTIGLVGSQISATAPLGAKTVDIDPLLNVAVLVDSENNRVLLVPLPN